MMNSVIMYLVQSEAEIPIQPMPNTSYYIIVYFAEKFKHFIIKELIL